MSHGTAGARGVRGAAPESLPPLAGRRTAAARPLTSHTNVALFGERGLPIDRAGLPGPHAFLVPYARPHATRGHSCGPFRRSTTMSDLSDRLRTWELGVRRLTEQAEARLADATALVRELHVAGRARPAVLLGPVMAVRPYDPGCGPEDSGQVTQAALLVPEGLGVVYWDTEDLAALSPGPDREREARRLFTPAADLRPLVRVHLLPYAADLVACLIPRGHRR